MNWLLDPGPATKVFNNAASILVALPKLLDPKSVRKN
jgi:hypothetical protein